MRDSISNIESSPFIFLHQTLGGEDGIPASFTAGTDVSSESGDDDSVVKNKSLKGVDIEAPAPVPRKTKRGEHDGENSSDDYDIMQPVESPFEGKIIVPMAGTCVDLVDGDTKASAVEDRREVPNGCAICLSPFENEDRIAWSSNTNCAHVYHHECISDWLMASGAKHLRRQRRESERNRVVNYANDPILRITNFPMLCPCCRQPFVLCHPEKEGNEGGMDKPLANSGRGNYTQTTPATALSPSDALSDEMAMTDV